LNKISAYFLLFFAIGCTDKPAEPLVITKTIVKVPKDSVIPIVKSKADTSLFEKYLFSYGLTNVNDLDTSIKLSLKYSDTANFLHICIYDTLTKALLPCAIALRLCNVQYYLKHINPDLSLIIFDATRPLSKQKLMWDSLKMEPNYKYNYVSPPWDISLHNYGAAVDLSIIDIKKNQLLDMGTSFDYFGKLAEPIYEYQFLKNKQLSDTAYKNRLLLRDIMKKAYFYSINSEWWHFNACNKDFAALTYTLIK